MATMNAVQVHKFGGPEVLEYSTNVPRPKPGPDDVLVQIKAGIVEEVGSNVTTLKVGQQVYGADLPGMGSYAQFVAVRHNFVHPLHNSLTFSQGASIFVPYFTAYRALNHLAQAKPGETVFIHGASGGVGIAAVQISSGLGLTVIGTASTPEGQQLVKKAEAHFVFNHYEEGYLEKAKEAAGGRGIDVILENVVDQNLKKDVGLVRDQGRIILIGTGATDTTINPIDVLAHEIVMKALSLYKITDEEVFETSQALSAGVKAGWLNPYIWKEFPLEKAADAHTLHKSGSGAHRKIVLTVD